MKDLLIKLLNTFKSIYRPVITAVGVTNTVARFIPHPSSKVVVAVTSIALIPSMVHSLWNLINTSSIPGMSSAVDYAKSKVIPIMVSKELASSGISSDVSEYEEYQEALTGMFNEELSDIDDVLDPVVKVSKFVLVIALVLELRLLIRL